MLNLKKVIALVCVLALTLSTVAFGATYTDVTEDSAYYEAVETLNKLAIVTGYEDGTFKPEDGVTRAEMAALIARIQGYGDTAKAAANTGFADVPSSHWASGYIANAAGTGIINGYGDGNFGPEDPVLYEQAVKMVMATLGYTPFAEKNGGYPTGYLAAAQRYDVSLAVANAAVGSEANRGTIAQILANALDTPLMVQSRWSNTGEVDYVIADGSTVNGYTYGYKTLMSENLGYVKIRGIVEANAVSDITQAKTIDTTKEAAVKILVKDEYKTENSVYLKDFTGASANPRVDYYVTALVGDTDVADYLGQSVVGYVKKVDNDWVMMSAAVDTARNEELVIALDQYAAGGVATVSGGVVTAISDVAYYKEGANDTTDIKVEAGAELVVNGAYVDITSSVDIATEVGSITTYGGTIRFVDNDDANGADVVFVDYAATGVVDEVGSKKVTFKNLVAGAIGRDSIKYDLDDENKVLVVKKDGEEIDVAELAEWDIVSIYATAYNANYIVMEVIGTQVVGTVASTKASDTSATGTAYRIDGTWYDAAEGHYDADKIEINLGGTIYIDEFGKIAAFVEDSALAGGAAANYGFVLGASAEAADFGGSTPDIKLQVLTAEGVKIMALKNNFRLEDGSAANVDLTTWSVSASGVVSGDGGDWATIQGYVGDVVRYEANADGYITKLTEEGHGGASTAKFNEKTLGATALEFDAENNKFTLTTGSGANDRSNTNGGYVEADTIVFIVDVTRDGLGVLTGYDAADCLVATVADLNDKDTVDVLASYMDAKADTTDIIVVEKASLAVSTTAGLAVVKTVGSATNDEGESILEITFLANGEEVTAKTTADAALAASAWISEGDIAKIKVGSNGLISSVASVFDFGAEYEVDDDDNVADAGNDSGDEVWVAIRDKNLASDNATAKAAYTGSGIVGVNEAFAGGVVTGYNKKTQEATISDLGTAGTYKLSTKGANVYLIDATGRSTIIEVGSYGDFGYFAALYDGTAGKLYEANNSTPVYTGMADATAKTYADHVYVRTYEDKVTDVVIVKGSIDDVE